MSRSDLEAIILTQAIISILSDFILAAFPIFYFWRLQVDLKTKIGLWLLMGLGLITGVCCIVRTVLNNESLPDDATYNGIVNWTWRLFEVQFGIIAACIPPLRPLYARLAARWKGEHVPVADSNIKFLHSEDQGQRWIEKKDTRHGKHSNGDSSSSDHSPQPHTDRSHKQSKLTGTHSRQGDDMRSDLVREGIVKSGANTNDEPSKRDPDKSNHNSEQRQDDAERGMSTAGLQNDMMMYGISDDIPSPETESDKGANDFPISTSAPDANSTTPSPTTQTTPQFDFGFAQAQPLDGGKKNGPGPDATTAGSGIESTDIAQRGEFGQDLAPADVTKPASGPGRGQRSMDLGSTTAEPQPQPPSDSAMSTASGPDKGREEGGAGGGGPNLLTNPAAVAAAHKASSPPNDLLPISSNTNHANDKTPPNPNQDHHPSTSSTSNSSKSSTSDEPNASNLPNRQPSPDPSPDTPSSSSHSQKPHSYSLPAPDSKPKSEPEQADATKHAKGPGEELMDALKKDGIASFGGDKSKVGVRRRGGSGSGSGSNSNSNSGSNAGLGPDLQGVRTAPAATVAGGGGEAESGKGHESRGGGGDTDADGRDEGDGHPAIADALKGPEMWEEVSEDTRGQGGRRSIGGTLRTGG